MIPDEERRAPAPFPTFRLIPSRFPPVAAFESVATPEDAAAVMELEGWTNDRLVATRAARLPRDQWVLSRANASVMMAAFLHAAPSGGRFNGPDLGAWYAAASLRTAAAEVAHHLRRELFARDAVRVVRTFRCYRARLDGLFFDVRGTRPDLHARDSYAASQVFGEAARAAGEDGILYDSVRDAGGTCVAAFRPPLVRDVVQAEHLEVAVPRRGRVVARRLGG